MGGKTRDRDRRDDVDRYVWRQGDVEELPPATPEELAALLGSTESEERDSAVSLAGDALTGVQVRISAAGAPFHPGHTPGVGPHGQYDPAKYGLGGGGAGGPGGGGGSGGAAGGLGSGGAPVTKGEHHAALAQHHLDEARKHEAAALAATSAAMAQHHAELAAHHAGLAAAQGVQAGKHSDAEEHGRAAAAHAAAALEHARKLRETEEAASLKAKLEAEAKAKKVADLRDKIDHHANMAATMAEKAIDASTAAEAASYAASAEYHAMKVSEHAAEVALLGGHVGDHELDAAKASELAHKHAKEKASAEEAAAKAAKEAAEAAVAKAAKVDAALTKAQQHAKLAQDHADKAAADGVSAEAAAHHAQEAAHHAAQVGAYHDEVVANGGDGTQTAKLVHQADGDAASAGWDAQSKADAAAAAKAKAEAVAQVPGGPHPHLAEKVGDARGSNEGGFYRGADGKLRYVKFYQNPEQAHSEHVTNAVYNALGLDAPKSEVFSHNGRTAYASDVIEGGRTLAEHSQHADTKDRVHLNGMVISKSAAKEVTRGFAADVLLQNWDAVGPDHANVLVKDGKAYRIDSGGALAFRAQGSKKPEHLLKAIHEWDSLTQPNTNAAYAAVYQVGKPTPTQMIAQIKAISALEKKHGSWRLFVDAHAPDSMTGDERARVAGQLKARADLLKAKAKELEAAKSAAKAAKSAPGGGEHHVIDFHEHKVAKSIAAHVEKVAHDQHAGWKFYNDLGAKAGINAAHQARAREIISSWTGEYRDGDTHQFVYRQAAKLMTNGKSSEPTDDSIKAHADARAKKWRAFLDATGHHDVPTPTHLEIHRGMKGEGMVREVAKAWMSGATHATLPHDEVASWSLSKQAGNRFAGQYSDEAGNVKKVDHGIHGVLMTWRAPLANTIFDQAVDDGSFIGAYKHEHEVIAGPGHRNGLPLPRENFTVFYKGKQYTYAQRHELAKALHL